MTPTLKQFIKCLRTHGVTPGYEFASSKWIGNSQSSPSVIIPAAHQSVGALTVYDDTEELTIEIGQLHHTHFSAYNYDHDTADQRLRAATEAAARFVADVFRDRVYFSIDYSGERCIGSSHGYVDAKSQAAGLVRTLHVQLLNNESTRSERFLWSGPIDTGPIETT